MKGKGLKPYDVFDRFLGDPLHKKIFVDKRYVKEPHRNFFQRLYTWWHKANEDDDTYKALTRFKRGKKHAEADKDKLCLAS